MHRIILPLTVFAAMLFLLGLGTWQMQRLAWKETLIAEREAGLAMPAAPLPGHFDDVEQAEAFGFRTVTVTGVFRHDLEQLYGARARSNVLGHHILTPLVPADGHAVLIDRGWVPADKVHPASRPQGQLEGAVTIRGIARYRSADRPGMFTPDNDPAAGRWYHYDLAAMAAALDLELSPIVVEADESANPGGLPIGGRTLMTLANNHLQYAITWYGLAAALLGVYIVFRRQNRARPEAATCCLRPPLRTRAWFETEAFMKSLRSITAATIVLTFGLILLGAWVRATNSGLSCPDWPTCYGYWVPLPSDIPADAGYAFYQVMLEWVHRLIAGVFVGPLVLLIAWLCWRHRGQARMLPSFGVALVALLFVQVSLGAVTVLDQNSPWSVAVHKTTALLLFATMLAIFERAADRPAGLTTRGLALHAALGWCLLLGTIASAAVMSKSGASLACSSPFLCNESLLPDFDDPLERLHMIHRLLALITFVTLAVLGFRLRQEARLAGIDRMIGALLVIQITLGMLTVAYEIQIALALAHQANGILLFATVSLLLARIIQADTRQPAAAGHLKTMTSTPA